MTSPVIQFKRGAFANLPALQAGEPALTTDTFEFYVGIDSTTNGNKFFGSHRYWTREGTSTGSGVNLVEGSLNGSSFITLKSPDSLAGITTYTFPATPTDGYFLKTNSSGQLAWEEVVSNFNIAGDTGSDSVSTGSTITFVGGTNVNTAVTDNTVTINLDDNVSVSGVITATTFSGSLSGNASSADQVKTVDASNTAANYYLTFVDVNNGSATNETVYTDDGIYYNPGTNTLITQHVSLTGNLNVAGITTLAGNVNIGDASGDTITVKGTATFDETITGTATTAIRANSVDVVGVATNQNYYITLVDGSGNSKSVGVDTELLYNPSTNTFTVGTGVGITQFSSSVSTGSSTSSVPTSSAVITYVAEQIAATDTDDDLGIAGDTGTGTINLDNQSLTVAGTANEITTSASGQTITVGLPDSVTVTTALTTPTVNATNLKANDGTTAITITNTTGAVATNSDLTVGGNLYVNGNTTQVNTAAITVEDRTIELGVVDGAAPSSTTTWDLGVLFNYYDGSAKKSALVWEQGDARFKLGSVVSDGGGTGNSNPQLTVSTFAPLEIGSLWVTDCAGTSQVISCTGTTRKLENITIDAGTF